MNAQEMREQGQALVEEGRCKIIKGCNMLAMATTLEAMKVDMGELPVTTKETSTYSNGNGHIVPLVKPDYSHSGTNMAKLETFIRCQTRPVTLKEVKENCPIPGNTAGSYLYGQRYKTRFRQTKDGKFVLAK